MSVSAPGPFFTLGSLGLPVSQADFLSLWLTQMQAAFPGYTPNAADLEYIQAQIFASWAADEANLCTSGATELFRQFGVKLLSLAYQVGTSAQAILTVTAQDTNGYTLPQGTQFTLTLNGQPIGFQAVSPLTIPNGASTGNVVVAALQTGTANNLAGAPASLVSQITWVTGVTVVSNSTGGVDQESDDQYVNRLANTLQLLAPRPITANDYAVMAVNFTPAVGTDQEEVGRATAIDGYDPGSNTYGNEREVTVCVTDANGLALNSDTLTAVQTYLAALREVNFIVNVVSPNYTTIYVACTVKGQAGYPAATIQANVQAALLNYLNPANFGLPLQTSSAWTNQTTIFRSKVEAIVQGAGGVDHIVQGLGGAQLFVDVNSNPTNQGDLAFGGPFPLPLSTTTSIPLASITVT